ncbi:hypothetical protein ACSQ67_013520 [Phaseolus vulgaris]
MKLIGDGADGRKLIVRVKLDHRSRKLQTWALVKVAETGDIAVLVQEAKAFSVFAVILATSKSHHTVPSSAWVAKYRRRNCRSVSLSSL